MPSTPASPPPSVSDDDFDRAGQAGRRAWVAPDVRQLRAGEAEFNPVITNDSEGTVS
jgi:hypothetical protein